MDQQTNPPSVSEYQYFSELIKREDADDVLDELPGELLLRFAAELDQVEADRIWIAADQFSVEYWTGAELLIARLIRLSSSSGKSAWTEFHAALIRFSSGRYLDWCKEKIGSLASSADRREALEDWLVATLAFVIRSIEPGAARTLTLAILAIPSHRTRMKLLNSIASLDMPAERQNPILMLANDGDEGLSSSISGYWEARFNETSTHGVCLWSDPIQSRYETQFPPAVLLLARHTPVTVMREVGYSAGIRASTPLDVRQRLIELGVRHNHDTFIAMGNLWYLLRQMHELTHRHDSDAELTGLRAELRGLVEPQPMLWVLALPWILLHAQSIKREVIAITCQLGRSNKQIGEVLRQQRDKAEVSTLAMGMLALINGIANPADQHTLALADSLAHYFDGTPKFPSPLAIRSATWLGSERLEKYLRDRASRASHYFRQHVLDRIGSQEEALTATLMNELLVQFRDSENLPTFMHSESLGAPNLRLSQREIGKRTEEPQYGCDLAFIVKVHAEDVYRMEWGGLVQVKKTLAKDAHAPTADSWKIDIAQLQTIIKACSTSVYFLVCADGEVLVVPSRHLMGYVRGRVGNGKAKSCTLGYNDVRSAAIPLEQYLVDLLVGQWIGTTAEETLEFINGNSSLKPRHIVEVEIEFTPKQRG